MTERERVELRRRLRAGIGDFNGLSRRQLAAHVEHVAAVVEAAHDRNARALAHELSKARERERHARKRAS